MTATGPTHAPVRTIGGHRFDFGRQVAVMAVVNRTPDSFHDRGATYALDAAVDSAVSAAAFGADWVDVGGLAFSPDTPDHGVGAELERVLPVVEAVAGRSDVVISVDTWRPEVAAAAVAAGAAVINDTSGLADHDLARVAADTGATLVLTHSLAAAAGPHVHVRRPSYGSSAEHVVDEVRAFLAGRIALATSLGVREDQLVIDPGHDLNKNTLHSLALTRALDRIADLGPPVLAAVSNKDFVGEAIDRPRGRRVTGSVVAAAWCIERGARIIRMHDVAQAVDTARMCEVLLGLREPARLFHNM